MTHVEKVGLLVSLLKVVEEIVFPREAFFVLFSFPRPLFK